LTPKNGLKKHCINQWGLFIGQQIENIFSFLKWNGFLHIGYIRLDDSGNG